MNSVSDLLTTCLSGVNVIAGRPGMGKSSLAINMTLSHHPPKRILYFSLEMFEEEVKLRMLSALSKMPFGKIKSSDLNIEESKKLTYAKQLLVNKKMVIDDRPDLHLHDIEKRCEDIFANEGGMVIIDYVQLVRPTKKFKTFNEAIVPLLNEVGPCLQKLSQKLNIGILVLSQLDRSLESREDKRPQTTDFKRYESLLSISDNAWCIYRDEVYNPKTQNKGLAEVICLKSRSGKNDTFKLNWEPETLTFVG